MCWGSQNTQSQGAGKDWLPEKKKTYYGGRLSMDRRYNRQISEVNQKKNYEGSVGRVWVVSFPWTHYAFKVEKLLSD